MNYPRHYTIDNYLRKVRIHSEPYAAEVAGMEIIIFPNVMSPRYDRSAQMLIAMMPDQKGKDVLEIGSGTGILSLSALRQGASSVLAIDINPSAVENTKANFDKYGFSNAEARHSDLFESVDGTFDAVIFNAPFHGNKAEDMLELGTSDCNYETLRGFLRHAGDYLNPDGQIYLGFADTGDNELLKRLIYENRYQIRDLRTCPNGDWTMYLYTLLKKQMLDSEGYRNYVP